MFEIFTKCMLLVHPNKLFVSTFSFTELKVFRKFDIMHTFSDFFYTILSKFKEDTVCITTLNYNIQ